MKPKIFWLVSLLILIAAGTLLLARKSPPAKSKKPAPASIAKIDGTDLKRLTLLPEAAKRLDIQTALVREEPFAATRKVGGEVVSVGPGSRTAVVQVNLVEAELKRVRRTEPAFILSLAHDNKATPIQAMPIKAPPGLAGLPGSAFYQVTGTNVFVKNQLVFVEIPLSGTSDKRKTVPYAAVLYDPHGNTWVYSNPEPLVFIRQPISIESIQKDQAILSAGPLAGTAVVTVGGAELYGTEFGVGK